MDQSQEGFGNSGGIVTRQGSSAIYDAREQREKQAESPVKDRKTAMKNLKVPVPTWVTLGSTEVEQRCRGKVLEKIINWLSKLAPDQRPRSLEAFQRAAKLRRLLTLKVYEIDTVALAGALGASADVRDRILARKTASPLSHYASVAFPEDRIVCMRRNWLRMMENTQPSVPEMVRWIESQAFLQCNFNAAEVVSALLECGIVRNPTESTLDFSTWVTASVEGPIRQPTNALFHNPVQQQLHLKSIVRRIELPFGCTPRQLIGARGARIAKTRERLMNHIYEHFPDLNSEKRPLILFHFGATAVMLTVRLPAVWRDVNLKLVQPKAANAAFKSVILDFLRVCKEIQCTELVQARLRRMKLQKYRSLEGKRYQAEVNNERRAHVRQSSLQRALTLPSADTRQDISTLPCIRHFRSSPLKVKARQRRQRKLAEKRSTLLRASQIMERHHRRFIGMRVAVADESTFGSSLGSFWSDPVFASICVGDVPSEFRHRGQRVKKTAKRLARQLKQSAALQHVAVPHLAPPLEASRPQMPLHQTRNQRHCRSSFARQHFAADFAECLNLKQEGCLFR